MTTPRPLVPLLLAVCACAHAGSAGDAPAPTPAPPAPEARPAPAPPPDAAALARAARVAEVRADVERLLASQGERLWQGWLRGVPPDLDGAGVDETSLFSRDTILLVRAARDAARGDERRALTLLQAFLVGEHLARAAAASPAPGPAAVPWDGGSVPAWRVPGLLAAEPEAGRRASLERAALEAQRRNGPAEAAHWSAVAAAAGRLGHDSLLALAAELRGEPVDALAALADATLAATEAPYRALLEAMARSEMAKGLADLRGRDLPRLFRTAEDPRSFPVGRAAGDALRALSDLGLGLGTRAGVVLDAEARPGKDPRALTLPVKVPDAVRVSYVEGGGVPELRGLLHELGAAAYYAHVTAPGVEFRRLGTVTPETWAGLFQDLAGDPAWLAERTRSDEHHLWPLVRAGAARRLHAARTLSARILVEVARARDPQRAPAAARGVLERAMARPVDEAEVEGFLLERDPLLQAADALRAVLLAAQAEAFLTARAPPAWWRSRASGTWLAAAFADGARLPPSELARSLGAERLDPAALAATSGARAEASGVRVVPAAAP